MKLYDKAIKLKKLYKLVDMITVIVILSFLGISLIYYSDMLSIILIVIICSLMGLTETIIVKYTIPPYVRDHSLNDLKTIKRLSESPRLDKEISKQLILELKQNRIIGSKEKVNLDVMNNISKSLRTMISNYYYDFYYWDELVKEFNVEIKKGSD